MHSKITRYCAGFALFSLVFVFLGLGFFQLGQADYASILANNPAAVNTEPTPERQTIIIDPGHGGRDSGAVGVDRSEEKDINLTLSLILADLLRISGYNVIMTRTEDDDLGNDVRGQRKLTDLQARVRIANQNPDAIFISIHMNTFPQENVWGMRLYHRRNCEISEQLARYVSQANQQFLQPENDYEIKSATSSIFVLNRAGIPAILVECGFLTNPAEAALLNCPDYQRKLALVIASAVWRLAE